MLSCSNPDCLAPSVEPSPFYATDAHRVMCHCGATIVYYPACAAEDSYTSARREWRTLIGAPVSVGPSSPA